MINRRAAVKKFLILAFRFQDYSVMFLILAFLNLPGMQWASAASD